MLWRYMPLIVAGTLAILAAAYTVIDRAKQIAAIERSRAQITLEACLDQNARHQRTERLLLLLGSRPKVADQIAEAVLPRRNCRSLVRDRYGFDP